jgi:hypothetical protein
MKVSRDKLKSLLKRRVRAAGINWGDLDRQACQIIVFGSYALSVNTCDSDLDILCIGVGKRYKSSKLHIIWIPEQRTHSQQWLGSELATHIAAYGVWIKGENNWAYQTKPGRKTIERKKNNILSRLDAAQRHWDDLLPKFQAGQLTKLRRDLQRYQMMQRGKAPAPKPLLDTEWRQHDVCDGWAALLSNRSEVARRIKKFLVTRKISKLAKTF